MLAENFLTAEQLLLPSDVYAAHVTVLRMLERAEIRPVSLDMNRVAVWYDSCGTIACIGGWVLIARTNFEFVCFDRHQLQRITKSGEQYELYYPDIDPDLYQRIKPEHAAQALRNFLTHGQARWKQVLSDAGLL